MIELGKFNALEILRDTSAGLYLGDPEGKDEDVLLPGKYIPQEWQLGDSIKVFVYNDSEDRRVATTLEPKIMLHEFACLEVKQVNKFGAFMDWGLDKDLMIPYKEQNYNMKRGEKYVVYLYLDEDSDRLAGSCRIDRFLDNKKLTVKEDQKVTLMVYDITELGTNVIINKKHKGLIYENETFRNLEEGDQLQGFIKKIRPDYKIDVSLQAKGYAHVEPNAQKILSKLKENNGFLNLTDKSDPEDIVEKLEMSKKTFKKAIGTLYKKRLIRLEEYGISLVEGENSDSSGSSN